MGPSENGIRRMPKRISLNKMDVDNSEEKPACSRRRERLVHYYGTIKGEEVGKVYRNREKLKVIHHPDKSWIHLGPEGPYSIVLQGNKRFLDEGSLVIIFTKSPFGSGDSDKNTTCNTILGNLKKAVKGRLPIRVVRLIKSDRDRKTVFRYDGLYIMKKKLVLHEKLHFLLTRIKKQPKVLFNFKRGCGKIRRLLALKKLKKTKWIKKEPELKKEVTSNSDSERDSTTHTVEEICWDQLKEEYTALREESSYDYDDGYEVWQRSSFPSFVKQDSNEQLEESTYITYDEHVDKIETYYEELDDTVDDLNDEEDREHFSKEDVIIESIPLLKCENGESSNNSVRTILAIVPESGASEYVEESRDTDCDPLCDPLAGFSDESKASHCSDEMKNSSQEVKACYDEKKSDQLYLAQCANIDGSEKNQYLPNLPHPCLYNLTIGHLINLLGNRSNNEICPCNTQKCASQRNFEVALRGLIEEGGKKSCNAKCLKGIEDDDTKQLESTELNYFSSINNVFNQLNAIICNKTTISETRTPLIGKRHHIMTTRILKKDRTNTKNYYAKKVVSIEKSLVPKNVKESLEPLSDEESLLNSSGKDSAVASSDKESLTPSEVSSCTAAAYGFTSPIPEDTAIRLPLENFQNLEKPSQEQEPNDNHNKRRKGRQKGSKNFSREAAQLGPVIPTEEPKPIPRRLRDKKLSYRGATFYLSPRNTSSRSASRRRVQEEEEDEFLGFVGPIRPSKKLKLVRSFLTRLQSVRSEQSTSS
ncbi:unnamed protein product [Nezara viridula]|uniref:YDG domain-containing protein n=1 Tax=Nezara viridula TaxID=85310 RepID=A0A9P0MRT3_NEZVI|nr:unnamed protein product [Nezara viridula]